MNEGIDSGDLIQKDQFKFPKSLKYPKDYNSFIDRLLYQSLKKFILKFKKSNNKPKQIKQDESKSIYFPRLSSDVHGWINWNWTCKDIILFIRAFSYPYSGAKSRISSNEEDIVRIFDANIYKKDGNFHPFKNGIIYRIYKDKVYVALSPFAIEINNFFEDNIGVKVRLGDRLFNLSKDLDKANSTRIFFGPQK